MGSIYRNNRSPQIILSDFPSVRLGMLWFLRVATFSVLKCGLPQGRRTLTAEADRQGWYRWQHQWLLGTHPARQSCKVSKERTWVCAR